MKPTPRPRGHRGLAQRVRSLFDEPLPLRPEADSPGHVDVAWVSETGRPLSGAGSTEPLIEAVEAYLLAGPGAESQAGPALDRAIEKARGEPASPAMVDAVESLIRYSAREDAALERARALVTPGVATLLVERLSRTTDGGDRARLVQGIAELGDEVRDAALTALRAAPERGSVEQAPGDGLLLLLGTLARGTPGMLEELVRDADWRVVVAGLSVVAARGGDGVLQILTLALAHGHPRVRAAALSVIRKLGGGEAGELARAMLGDPDRGVRAEAARTIGDLNVSRGAEALRKRLAAEHDSRVLVACIEALGLLRDADAVPELARLSGAPGPGGVDDDVRRAALHALHRIGTPQARALVDGAAGDGMPGIREFTPEP